MANHSEMVTQKQFIENDLQTGKSGAKFPTVTVALVFSALFCVFYAFCFYESIADYWFHPGWTTDDAIQQVYPFHEVYHPGLFNGDIITRVMTGYLAPLHYWFCYFITWLTGDPIMMSHWVMLIQLVLTLGFYFGALKRAAGLVPAFLGLAWMIHTRHTMQRITGGLPRGWAAVVFASFLYFVLAENHVAVLIVLFCGCLLNPPATLVAAMAYGMLLLWRSFTGERKAIFRRRLFQLVLLSPLYALTVLYVVHQPAEIGQMVNFDVAASMPEFQRPDGRFPFLPFPPPLEEIRVNGLQAFIGRFYNPAEFWRRNVDNFVIGALLIIAATGLVRKRKVVPAEVLLFGVAAIIVYFLSRIFAFRLYVPNRHLQIPLAFFLISTMTIGAWRAFHKWDVPLSSRDSRIKQSWPSLVALAMIGVVVFACSHTGLFGAANFNYTPTKKGNFFLWMQKNTPENSLIAGHPTHLDGVQLFAIRRGYVTTETTHPFYTGYYDEMKRRTIVSLKAHYSRSLEELVSILEPEKIDYFVFKRSDFYPDQLPEASYFPPFKELMHDLTSRPLDQYAFKQLPAEVDVQKYPFVPFKDRYSVIVDIKKLKEYLNQNGNK